MKWARGKGRASFDASEPVLLVCPTTVMHTLAAVPSLAIWRSHMPYGPLTRESDQNSVLPGLKRNFTPSWL